MHRYTCRDIYLHVQVDLSKIIRLCSQPFLQSLPLAQMEICSHFSALVPERVHHKVHDRAGAVGKQPRRADASAREDGAELRGGK